MHKTLFLIASLLGFSTLSLEATAPKKKLTVVATFSVLGDMIRQIGQNLVDVKIIVPENSDPHIYQSTPQDAKLISKADMVIRNGFGFEGWFDRLIDNSGYKGPHVVATQYVTARPLLTATTQNQYSLKDIPVDPHAWHSVKNAILYAQTITEALITALPNHKQEIEKNYQRYKWELENLDTWVHQQYADIPETDRYVITTHDAFWYYGNAYGIQFLSPVGISTDAEPAASAVAQLIRDIKNKNIRAVFIENLSSRKLIEEIAKEANVSIEGVLYADSLSNPQEPNSAAPSYLDMIRHNTREIVKQLGKSKK